VKILQLKNLFLTNTPLAIISLLLGYSFWYIASYNQIISIQMNAPLCFSASTDNYTITAPETIAITITAPRCDLYALDKETLAAHVNIDKLLPGNHGIILTEHHFFFPKNILLTNYKPANLCITIAENKTL
jgi:hypothetical protein